MRIVVVGAGGVGGYFGARLAAAGEDVVFVARGAHGKAIRDSGLKILSANGDLVVKDAQVVETPAEAGTADIVAVCVKLWDTEAVAEQIRPLVGPETGVISFQNGVDAEGVLTRVLGKQAVMGGTAQIAAIIAEPGTIRHTGTMARLVYGELDGSRSARAQAFDAACAKAGFDHTLADDVELEIWNKFSFLAPFAGATAYFRSAIGPIREDPDKREVFEALVSETLAVGRALGVAFAEDRQQAIMSHLSNLPAEMKSSMLGDLERGNRLELDWLTGAVVQLGERQGVVTPVSRQVYDALALYKDG